MIEAYMKEHRKEFIDYFVRYTDINPYHVRGNLDFDAIKDILEISPLPEHSKSAVDKIITSTKQTAVVIQTKSKQDVVKKIESIYLETVEKGKPLSENHVNAVKALLGRLNYSKLQPDFIAAVENMHPDIKEFMNIRRAEMEIAEKARIEIAGKQSKTNAIEETVELLEAKLMEEVNEYLEDKNLEELADIMEVLFGLAHNLGYTEEDLLNKREEKLKESGGFKEGIVLKKVY